MPLFVCSKCDTIENTATGDYWSHVRQPPPERKPLCSECSEGKWHSKFEKRIATPEYLAEHAEHFVWVPPKWHERLAGIKTWADKWGAK